MPVLGQKEEAKPHTFYPTRRPIAGGTKVTTSGRVGVGMARMGEQEVWRRRDDEEVAARRGLEEKEREGSGRLRV